MKHERGWITFHCGALRECHRPARTTGSRCFSAAWFVSAAYVVAARSPCGSPAAVGRVSRTARLPRHGRGGVLCASAVRHSIRAHGGGVVAVPAPRPLPLAPRKPDTDASILTTRPSPCRLDLARRPGVSRASTNSAGEMLCFVGQKCST